MTKSKTPWQKRLAKAKKESTPLFRFVSDQGRVNVMGFSKCNDEVILVKIEVVNDQT